MLQYLINTTAIWLLSLAIFDLFLRRESYHGYNRFYLLFTFLLGLSLPLVHWQNEAYTKTLQTPIQQVITAKENMAAVVTPSNAIGLAQGLLIIYLLGALVAASLLIAEIIKLAAFYRKGKKSKQGGWIIIETGREHGPFSLLHILFVCSLQQYGSNEWDMVLSHEKRHHTLFHFADLVLLQVSRIVFWFHPLVYVYNKRLLLVHEYQADGAITALGKATGQPLIYGKFLLEQALLQSSPSLAHSFNRSPIKKRIIMLTRRSSAASKAKMFLFIPLAMVSLLCCSKNLQQRKGIVIDVRDGINAPLPSESGLNHTNHEVEVYKTQFGGGNAYRVYFYRTVNDSVRCFGAINGSDENFDKVQYKWVDDTSATICLFNSKSKKEDNFKVSGTMRGQIKSTSMTTPE